MNRRERDLDAMERLRYRRHLSLPEVGLEGQRRLKAASVIVVGAGGLGSPALLYLAAAGVGRLGLVEFDRVEAVNLQRQVLYGTRDIGRAKLKAASDRLEDLNPHVEIRLHDARLDARNAMEILRPYDLVVDGTDNFPTRYLVNDACHLLAKPRIHGSVFRFEGRVTVFRPGRGPCYRCLFPEPPPAGTVPSCAEGGVLGVLPGIIGAIQAAEAIKLILGAGKTLAGRLLVLDALEMRFHSIEIRRDPACPLCGERPTITTLAEHEAVCGPEPRPLPVLAPEDEITPTVLHEKIRRGDRLLLLDVRTPLERALGTLDGSLHVPLDRLRESLGELDRTAEIVVFCRVGERSAAAVGLLKGSGFRKVRNLRGGLEAWATQVDPAFPVY